MSEAIVNNPLPVLRQLALPVAPPDPVLPPKPSAPWRLLFKFWLFIAALLLAIPWLFEWYSVYIGWAADAAKGRRQPEVRYMVTEDPATGERSVHWIEIDGKRYNPPGHRIVRPWN
jgi:hypothetical protein